MAIKFLNEVIQKEGKLTDGNIAYNITLNIVNNELTRLYCEITRDASEQGAENVNQSQQIGYITLEYGRQVSEIAQGENLIPHLNKFQEILDEVTAIQETNSKTDKKE